MPTLYLVSGDAYTGDRRITITVTESGSTVDLTGVDLTFMVKKYKWQADGDAVIDKTTPAEIEIPDQSGADRGKAYVALEEIDTEDLSGRYYWELEGDDSEGAVTLASGRLYVTPDLVT